MEKSFLTGEKRYLRNKGWRGYSNSWGHRRLHYRAKTEFQISEKGPGNRGVVGRARKWHEGSRFPAFWGPNYDWIPDQDHGGVLLKAVQAMLIQTDGRKIFLLPAWPKDWDVDFKVHAPYRTVIEGKVRHGQITQLKVIPPSRQKDIEIMK